MDGKELAIYIDSLIIQWNVLGLDNLGKFVGNNRFYYMKDHLGSVRAILDEEGNVVSAQDYDMWGYLLQDRTYVSDESIYKFTGKERDKESEYDYFGARYYDARIGRWGSIDPLLEKHLDFSPYNYVLNNPLFYVDPKGKQVAKQYNDPGIDFPTGPPSSIGVGLATAIKELIKCAFENPATV